MQRKASESVIDSKTEKSANQEEGNQEENTNKEKDDTEDVIIIEIDDEENESQQREELARTSDCCSDKIVSSKTVSCDKLKSVSQSEIDYSRIDSETEKHHHCDCSELSLNPNSQSHLHAEQSQTRKEAIGEDQHDKVGGSGGSDGDDDGAILAGADFDFEAEVAQMAAEIKKAECIVQSMDGVKVRPHTNFILIS